MSACRICGAEIRTDEVHLIYAFVGSGETDVEASELCQKHTDEFIEFIRGKNQ